MQEVLIDDLTSEYVHVFTRDMENEFKTKIYLFKTIVLNFDKEYELLDESSADNENANYLEQD